MSIANFFNRVKNNGDAKTVINNFAWLSALQIAGYIFPLITIPYLAKVIGVDGFGKIAFASAVIVWIQTIADWGFNFTATRDVAKNKYDKIAVSEIFSNVLWARILLMIISLAVLVILVISVPVFNDNAMVIFATFLMIPGHICFPDWFFQAVEKMKYITILNLLFKLLFTLSIFLVVKEKNDYLWQPILISLGYVVCGVISMYIILVKWGVKLCRFSFAKVKKTISSSTDVFINNLAPNLYNSFSVMLLGLCGGSQANGILDGGNKFVNITMQFQSILSRVFFPYISRNEDKIGLFARINNVCSIVLCLILFLFAPTIIHLMLSEEFNGSIVVLRLLAISLVFTGLTNTYGTNYLIVRHKEKLLRNLTLLSSIIGFIIAIPLIYYFSVVGAALTILLSRVMLGVFSFVSVKRIENNELLKNTSV